MWTRVEQYKPIFVEPKGKQDFLFAMENFYEKVNNPSGNGACFAAVCRGKVSLRSPTGTSYFQILLTFKIKSLC